MLTLYRRHLAACPHSKDKKTRGTQADEKNSCDCPVWLQGTWEGKPTRKSLDVTSWRKAEKLKRQLEDGIEPKAQPKSITIKDALEAFIADCEARNLNASTLRKYRGLQRRINLFGQDRGIARCEDFTASALKDFRGTWNLSPRTAGKELERLRAFFRFCVENEWITKNPAKAIKAPQVKVSPRIPFSEDEIQKILAHAKDDRELAFILTLRHTGLRIGDASLLKVSQVSDGRVYLYTTKAGIPVSVKIPPTLASLLKQLPPNGGYFFLRGESTSMHTTADLWRRRIKILCKEAKVMPDHPHRFRHSLAADLLMKGASVEDVAAILGNSPAIVIKHYSQWIRGRQERLDAFMEKTWEPRLVRVK